MTNDNDFDMLDMLYQHQLDKLENNRKQQLKPSVDKLFRDYLNYTDTLASAIAHLHSQAENIDDDELLLALEDDREKALTLAQPYLVEVGNILNTLQGMPLMVFFCESAQPSIQRFIENCWHGIGDWQS